MLNFGRSNFSISKCLEYNLEGKQVYTITMLSEHITVKCTNLGCSILSVYSPASNGEIKNIVAGFPNIRDYEHNRDYFGCVLGRYANRIEGGSFYLAGKKIRLSLNDGTNHLHGGLEGFNQKVWEIS